MKIRKRIAMLISMLLIISTLGCSSPKDILSFIISGKKTNNDTNETAQKVESVNKDAVFKEVEQIKLDDTDYISSMIFSNGRYYVTSYSYDYVQADDEETKTETENESDSGDLESKTIVNIKVRSFTDASDMNEVMIKSEGINKYYRDDFMGVDKDGNLYFLTNINSDDGSINSFSFEKYDSQGKQIKSSEISLEKNDDWINRVCMDHEGNLFVSKSKTIDIYNLDFNPIGQYKLPDENTNVDSMVVGDSGKIIFVTNKWENDKSTYAAYNLDKSGNATPLDCSSLIGDKTLLNSAGYEYIYRQNGSVFAFNDGDTSVTEIVNFYDSDINPNNLGELIFSGKESFITYDSGNAAILRFNKVPKDQVADKKIITLGCVETPYAISKDIIDYNKKSGEYRIKILDYSIYDNPDDIYAGTKRFNMDLASGNVPDIIISGNNEVNNLIKKGVFTDLSVLMEKKNDIKKEDLVYSAQHAFAKDDKLYCVFPAFTVSCAVIKKKNYKENMTIDDIIEWEKKTGNKALRGYMTNETVLMSLLNNSMDAFIDQETGKCSFNSDEFIKLLDYANSYPKEISYDYYNDYSIHEQDFRNDKTLFDFQYLDNFRSFNYEMQSTFGEETMLFNIPVKNSKGVSITPQFIIGISEKSGNKDEAWNFINGLLQSEKYNSETTDYYGFPALQSAFDKIKEESTQKAFYYDENKQKQYYEEYYWIGDDSFEIQPLTKEKVEELSEYVVHAERIATWDEDLNNIISEETQPLFLGQKNSKEVADIIQSRVQIYINEKQ